MIDDTEQHPGTYLLIMDAVLAVEDVLAQVGIQTTKTENDKVEACITMLLIERLPFPAEVAKLIERRAR